MIKKCLTILMVIGQLYAQSQERVEYSSGFKFTDGIYLSFQDFKNNNPIPVTHILSDFDIRNQDYLELVLEADCVTYFDNLLEERTTSILNIWGFSKNGKPHIGFNTTQSSITWDNRAWFPLLSIGAYNYFTAVIIVSRFIGPAPGAMMQSRGMLDDGAMFRDQGSFYDESVPLQMLLDFSNGELIQLASGDLNSVSPDLISQLIASDFSLLTEYRKLPKRDQKQSSMFYIRKYNMRNPISLPAN